MLLTQLGAHILGFIPDTIDYWKEYLAIFLTAAHSVKRSVLMILSSAALLKIVVTVDDWSGKIAVRRSIYMYGSVDT